LVVVPYAEADFGGGKIFDLAGKLLAVLSADRDIHLLHGFPQAVAHIYGRGVLALDVIVNVGDYETRLWSGWNEASFIFVWLVRVRQFPGPDNEAGASAVRLPALPVPFAVACRQEALEKNRMRVADVFRLYDFIEQARRQNLGKDVPYPDKSGFIHVYTYTSSLADKLAGWNLGNFGLAALCKNRVDALGQ